MDKMLELLKTLGLSTYVGTRSKNDSYIIDLDSDLDFGKIYSILEENDDVYQLEDNTLLTVHNASMFYEYDEKYQLNLKGNFDTEEYSLVITEIKD